MLGGQISAAAAERFIPTSFLPAIPRDHSKCQSALADELLSCTLRIDRNYSPSAALSGGDYSVYTGSAGVAYMYWMLANTDDGTIPMQKSELLARSRRYIEAAIRSGASTGRRSKSVSTMMTGMAGVYAVAAAIYTTSNEISRASEMTKQVLELAPTAVQHGVPSELLYGRVGYLSALLFLAANAGLRLSDHSEIVGTIVQLVVESFDSEQLLRQTVDKLLAVRFPSGNLPSSMGSENDVLVHWCHGAVGLVPLAIAAHQAYPKDSKYLEAARKAASVISERGLLRKGFGVCHGISGNAFALLCMDRADKSGGYGQTALRFGLFACQPAGQDEREAKELKTALLRQPDAPESLMEGEAGLACLLGALLQNPDSPNAVKYIGAASPWLM